MILYRGEVFDSSKQDELISSLKEDAFKTISMQKRLDYEKVIRACDRLYQRVMNHEFDEIALPLLRAMNLPFDALKRYASVFSREGLEKKVRVELGELLEGELALDEHNSRRYEPLGILFHIAAGNVDLLPAYSLVEGLLVGNVNILKLPSGDNGLSIMLLRELIKEEPCLKDYIYVFDVPSTEVETIKRLSALADATIVWGGEAACKAAREFVDIHSSLILWGHKISFSYVDSSVKDEELEALCYSIALSNQLYCSSTQGVYVDAEDKEELRSFAKRLLPIFSRVSLEVGSLPLTMKAKNSLTLYNEKLEGRGEDIYLSNGVSVIIKDDPRLELSLLYQNMWVKALPRKDIVATLKPNKNLLQTVSINRDIARREELCDLLFKAGVTRITELGDNSRMIAGEAHDGEYALRRYIRIVEYAK